MSQRKVYDPLLLTSKSTELLSLTAISGIILRTQHGQQSTAEYMCYNASNDDDVQQPTRYIYASQESVLEDQHHRVLEEQRKIVKAQKIQLEYEREIVRLKAMQLEKLLQINRSLSTSANIGDKLDQVTKMRQKVQQKKVKLKCSLQLMLIHLNRSFNCVAGTNKMIQKEFLQIIKYAVKKQKAVRILQIILNKTYCQVLAKVRKQQKVKKITLKTTKVLEIEDILRKQMEKYKKNDKQMQEKVCSKKIRAKIVKFV